ncbi:MAG: ribulose-phosphate 3-epimerase [Acidobacteria bacterium]|nr:ribulose-phosphate 3-epimerase [Acidobacteriota bacterium]
MSALIAPSILSADFTRLAEQIEIVTQAGADLLHLDVMDGRFVPNITFGPLVVKAIKRVSRIPLDVHLMIEEPDRYLESFAQAGANTISVHVEACPHLHRTVQQIKSLKVKAGVAVNPSTPVSTLEEILQELDYVLIMTVNPGFGGQEFIRAAAAKIVKVKSMIEFRSLKIPIGVDGGVGPDNADDLLGIGADVLIAGNSIFGASDPRAAITKFREAIARSRRRTA